MKIVKLYANDQLIGEYPDCSIMFSDEDREIYIVPQGVPWGQRQTTWVCSFPKICKNLSAICERQEDKK